MRRKKPRSRPVKPEVYFVLQRGTPSLKIGFTTDLGIRLSHLQISSPHDLICLGTIHDPERNLEEELHRRFFEYRVRGEWFRMEGELFQFIKDKFEARPERDKGAGWVFFDDNIYSPAVTLGDYLPKLDHSAAPTPVPARRKPIRRQLTLSEKITRGMERVARKKQLSEAAAT